MASPSDTVAVAAGSVYVMKPWWRPGLPALTADGELMVADEGKEGRRRNLVTIIDNLDDGFYDDIIPEDDRASIGRQARRWLAIIDNSQ